jgi:hypothetical protein
MKRTRQSGRNGFALVVTVVLLGVVAVVIAGVVGFVTNAARQTRIHLARSRCRLAAQTAIERAKDHVWYQFYVQKIGKSDASSSVKIDPKSAKVYSEWFGSLESNLASYPIPRVTEINGCQVYVSATQKHTEFCERSSSCSDYPTHVNSGIFVIQPILATAVCAMPGGPTVTVTLLEHVAFGTGQSEVFDYAYFVNNYGWMSGSSITINGDMRANGNVSLSQSTVNGFVYAAANDELGVTGSVTLRGSPKIKSASAYRSASSTTTRSRPDTNDYDTNGAYDAPAASGVITAPTYDENGNVKSGTVAAQSQKSIVNEESSPLAMPFVSDLENYVEYAKEYNNYAGGRLVYPAVTYTDTAGESRTVAGGTVYAHYSGTGPSGEEGNADQGALALVGTKANPIVIDGPVVVDSDVIIKGYVTGQGTIYAGRNIHIVGDVQYVNAPSWRHPDQDDAAVEAANESKDMLGLVAKGNIVIGDSSDSSWHSSVDSYIKGGENGSDTSVVHSYACDASDANIGYPSTFGGDYTAVEKVDALTAEQALKAPGGYDTASGQFGKIRTVKTYTEGTHTEWQQDRWGRWYQATVQNYVESDAVSYDRRYYETVCSDSVLQSLKDSSGISVVDAILYNNHAVMGTPGRSGSSFNLNGSLVCRDEALIFSGNGINFNWDMRLRRKNSSTSKLSLPPGPQPPYTYSWLQVSDDLNDAYKNRAKGN